MLSAKACAARCLDAVAVDGEEIMSVAIDGDLVPRDGRRVRLDD
jgi:hypothetical protein